MQDVCRLMVEMGGYRMAWFGLAEEGPGRPVRPVASAGADPEYLASAGTTPPGGKAPPARPSASIVR